MAREKPIDYRGLSANYHRTLHVDNSAGELTFQPIFRLSCSSDAATNLLPEIALWVCACVFNDIIFACLMTMLITTTTFTIVIIKNGVRMWTGRRPRAKIKPTTRAETRHGHKIRLQCRVSGKPPPRVTWFKDGVALPQPDRNAQRIRFKTNT